MQEIIKCACDLGSSTLKLVAIDKNNQLHCKDYITNIAACFDERSNIDEIGIKRLFSALDKAFIYIKNSGCKNVKLAATAAFRKAANSALICEQIRIKYGYECTILPQDEEANLTLLGAKSFSKIPIKALVDIGGASSEISLIESGDRLYFQSGLIDLLQTAGSDFSALINHASEKFAMQKTGIKSAHCSSKALIYTQSVAKNMANYEINDYEFAQIKVSKSELKALASSIDLMSESQKFRYFDANSKSEPERISERADGIKAACAILCALEFSEYVINPYALKEGLLIGM